MSTQSHATATVPFWNGRKYLVTGKIVKETLNMLTVEWRDMRFSAFKKDAIIHTEKKDAGNAFLC